MNGTEVHVDHVLGTVAVAWPDLPGYWMLDKPRGGRGLTDHRVTFRVVEALPAGMTRLADPTGDAAR